MSLPLDDPSFVRRLDPKRMYDLVVGFPDQVASAVNLVRESGVALPIARPQSVLLTGLGGSAAGGDFAQALFDAGGNVPFAVNRDYSLPAWAGPETLVFAVSYSGNTEETLAAYGDARRRGCPVVAVTSGGQLLELCRRDGVPSVQIPAGLPPRAALGHLFAPVARLCEEAGLIPASDWDSAVTQLRECASLWAVERRQSDNPTKQLAEDLHRKLILLYGLGHWQGLVARRWKGQIDENSKNLAFAHSFPELCHNEVLGWTAADKQSVASYAVVLLEDGTESAKMKKRAEVTARLIKDKAETYTVTARGNSLLEKMLCLTYFGDFVSVYLAALNEVDPENIDAINILKSELAKVG